MIAPQPFFEPRGTPFSILGRLKALSHLGHEVDLLTYHLGQDVPILGLVIHRTPNISFIKTIRIGPSMTKLFLDTLLLAKAFRMLQKSRYDLIHTHEEASFFGILLAKFFRIRHLYDMHSSLPQQLTNFRYTRFRSLIRLFEWLERRVINSSDAIITICPALEEYVKKINGHVPHVMIENVASEVDPEIITEQDLQKIKTAYSLDDKKVVLYTGTLEPYQGIDLLINSASHVLRDYKDVVFLLVGGKQDQVKRYKDQARALGLSSHFCFTGTRPPEEIPGFIKVCHILVSPRISGTNTPLKIYRYLQAGKPIIATDLYTHTQVLNPDVAVLVKPDPDALADGILRVLLNDSLAQKLGLRARQRFDQNYSFSSFIQKTEQILQAISR